MMTGHIGSIADGTATILVKDKILGDSSRTEFIDYLKEEGFKMWQHSKGHFGTVDWIFVNMNAKLYANGVPGIELAKPFGNHAVTIDEFKTIYKIYKKYEGFPVLQFEDINQKRNKSIGYHAPQYWHAKSYSDCPDIEKINRVLDVFKEKAKHTEEPDWYVKGACLYFTYNDDYYEMGPGSIDTTPEIFDRLSRELEDALYEIGAYDMFYGGMID